MLSRSGRTEEVILERVPDNRPQAGRILVAKLHGTAKHHARWRGRTEHQEAAAVAAVRELAAGRADLLAGGRATRGIRRG